MKNLLIIGAGGHGKVVLDIALLSQSYNQIAFIDDHKVGESVLGYPIIGKVSECKNLKDQFQEAIVAIGKNELRVEMVQKLKEQGYQLPVLIHPTACVSSFATIEEGTVIMPKAVINAGAKVGKASIINTGAVVEHDNLIGQGVHLSPNVALGGTVRIGSYSWVGIGATIINNVVIGSKVMIGAGAVVVRDVKDGQKVMGVPAK